MSTISDITQNVNAILASAGATFTCVYKGETKKAFGDSVILMDAWEFSFSSIKLGSKTTIEFDYFTGMGHRAKSKYPVDSWRYTAPKAVKPEVSGILNCILMDSDASSESFENWCCNYGYDTDSRKALNSYEACQINGDKLKRLIPHSTLELLREALQDY